MDFLRFFAVSQALCWKDFARLFQSNTLAEDAFWVNFPSVPGLKQIKSVRDDEQFFALQMRWQSLKKAKAAQSCFFCKTKKLVKTGLLE